MCIQTLRQATKESNQTLRQESKGILTNTKASKQEGAYKHLGKQARHKKGYM